LKREGGVWADGVLVETISKARIARAPKIELWYRTIHLAGDYNNEIFAMVEQTVEVRLGPQNAFEFECIGRLTRRVSANRVVSGAFPGRFTRNGLKRCKNRVHCALVTDKSRFLLDSGGYLVGF